MFIIQTKTAVGLKVRLVIQNVLLDSVYLCNLKNKLLDAFGFFVVVVVVVLFFFNKQTAASNLCFWLSIKLADVNLCEGRSSAKG